MNRFSDTTNANTLIAKIKAWVRSRKITTTDIDSTGATAGQVPTANGSGGTSWQTPSGGGGTQLYKHEINYTFKDEFDAGPFTYTFATVNMRSSAYSNVEAFAAELAHIPFLFYVVKTPDSASDAAPYKPILYFDGSYIYFVWSTGNVTSEEIYPISQYSISFSDTVTAL